MEDERELEMIADALLTRARKLEHKKPRDAGFYTERELGQRGRRTYTNQYHVISPLAEIAKREMNEMVESELEALAARAHLTDRERDIWWAYYVDRQAVRVIAASWAIDHRTVYHVLERCQEKLQAAMIACPWWGWLEVYWAEVNRG